MVALAARLAPAWLRRPRPTARLRLTIFYSALFVLSGACLLAIPYLLLRGTTVGTITYNAADHSYTYVGSDGVVHGTIAPAAGARPPRGSFFSGTSRQSRAMVEQLRALAVSQHASELHQLLVYSAVALAVMAAVSVLLGWLIAGRVLRPVRTITASARRITAHNLHERLALDGPDDEFKELSATLDDLLERLESSFQSQRRFVANASHELRTPLTVERTLLQVALADPDLTLETLRGVCEKLLTSGVRQERLIDALLTLASSESGLDQQVGTDLADICLAALPRPGGDAERLGLQIETAIGPAPLDGDPRLIERLVANLVDNAIGHNIASGHVHISTGTRADQPVLSVISSGPVVPPSEIDRLFEPFQRLDPRRTHSNGHGLGLSIVRAIADAHGATVTAEPQAEGGLKVEVVFPTRNARAHTAQGHES